MKAILRWIFNCKLALWVSCFYGFIAAVIVALGFFGGGDAPVGASMILHYLMWPASLLYPLLVEMLDQLTVSDRPSIDWLLFIVVFIFGGMIWYYLLSGVLLRLQICFGAKGSRDDHKHVRQTVNRRLRATTPHLSRAAS